MTRMASRDARPPPGYELVDSTARRAHRFATASGGSFRTTDSMPTPSPDADVVVPEELGAARCDAGTHRAEAVGQPCGLAALEEHALATNARFKDWECTDELMGRTRSGRALYMHCLPADVSGVSCASGEVSRSVFERARLDTYREASYKPFIIAAICWQRGCGTQLMRWQSWPRFHGPGIRTRRHAGLKACAPGPSSPSDP